MTGFGWDPTHSIVKARQEGLQTVLYKPFRADRLMEAVEQALRTTAAAARVAAPAPGWRSLDRARHLRPSHAGISSRGKSSTRPVTDHEPTDTQAIEASRQ